MLFVSGCKRVLRCGGRWVDPLAGVMGVGRLERTHTKCFLWCGAEEWGVLSKVYEGRRMMGYVVNRVSCLGVAVLVL